jgi:hypothetical protein
METNLENTNTAQKASVSYYGKKQYTTPLIVRKKAQNNCLPAAVFEDIDVQSCKK